MEIKKETKDLIKKLDIKPLDEDAMRKAKDRQDALAKPPGSLGRLEDISVRLAGITGNIKNNVERQCVLIMCADNGVTAEKVSSAPDSVTLSQTINFTMNKTGVGALAKTFGCDLIITDVGINKRVPEKFIGTEPGRIRDRKIAFGTGNIYTEDAMTYRQAVESVTIGAETALDAAKEYDILGVGEMGIGNTTTGAAVLSALTGASPKITVGRGGGITRGSFEHKLEVVEAVVRKEKSWDDPFTILAKAGGFDIGAMAGAFLGAASARVPVVIDGFISAVSALLACRIEPLAGEFMFASHRSAEPGYDCAMKAIGLEPMFDLAMRLGEGSGCIPAFKIIEGAAGVMGNMATFEEAEINDDYLEEIRQGDCF